MNTAEVLERLGSLARSLGIYGVTIQWPVAETHDRFKAMAISDRSIVACGEGPTLDEAVEQLMMRLGADDSHC